MTVVALFRLDWNLRSPFFLVFLCVFLVCLFFLRMYWISCHVEHIESEKKSLSSGARRPRRTLYEAQRWYSSAKSLRFPLFLLKISCAGVRPQSVSPARDRARWPHYRQSCASSGGHPAHFGWQKRGVRRARGAGEPSAGRGGDGARIARGDSQYCGGRGAETWYTV